MKWGIRKWSVLIVCMLGLFSVAVMAVKENRGYHDTMACIQSAQSDLAVVECDQQTDAEIASEPYFLVAVGSIAVGKVLVLIGKR